MAKKNNIAKQSLDIGETDILSEDFKALNEANSVNTDKKDNDDTEIKKNKLTSTDNTI